MGSSEYAWEKCEERVEMLREALQALIDVQNGPPLYKYKDDYENAMEQAVKALKETEQ